MLDDLSARRAGRREANLRLVNERIAESYERLANKPDDVVTILCECSKNDCESTIGIRFGDYEEIRDSAKQFVVLGGHADDDIEDIVRQNAGWDIVEKRGEAARAAERVLE